MHQKVKVQLSGLTVMRKMFQGNRIITYMKLLIYINQHFQFSNEFSTVFQITEKDLLLSDIIKDDCICERKDCNKDRICDSGGFELHSY